MLAASCILVVDDEFQIRRALKNALREVADRVVEAETGVAGIDLAATQHPDLVVLSARHDEGDKVRLLFDAVWGREFVVTEPGVGYRFEVP